MKRREFITLLGGMAVASPFAARAQEPSRRRRVAALMFTAENDPVSKTRVDAFQEVLGNLGWTIGRNLQIDYRWDISDPERARLAAAELLQLSPDVILAYSVSATRAAQEATRTIPIVFTSVSEPISLGLVASLGRPGGNTTGFTNLEPSIGGKWLELLKEIAPQITHVAVMFNPASGAIAQQFVHAAQAAAPKFSLGVVEAPVHDPAEIEAVMARLGSEPGIALTILPDTFLGFHNKLIVELAARNRIPTIYPFGYSPARGGLVSYGPDTTFQFRQAAAYVDRILRGERPADLPVVQPTKFEFIINLKTARTLGLTVPNTLLVAADTLID
jgi:putative ABC transport system substrate-binding protein